MEAKRKVKLLTYGMASMHKNRIRNASLWSESCFRLSEKPEAVLWEIRGEVFCSFVEDRIPKIQRVGKESNKSKVLGIIKINLEEMTFEREKEKYYLKTQTEEIQKDFDQGKLLSRFLTDDDLLW